MKKLKRMFVLAVTLCMVLTVFLPAYADEMTVQKQSKVRDDVLREGEITDLYAPGSVIYFEYDPNMKELYQNEAFDYYLVDSSWTDLTLDAGKWYVIEGTVTLQSRVENKSLLTNPANIILTNGCTLNAPYGIENGSRNALRIYGQDKDGGTGKLKVDSAPDLCAGIGGGYSPGLDEQGCGYVEINGGILEIHGGLNAAGIGGGGNKGGVDVSVTINAGKVTAYGGEKAAGIGTGKGSTLDVTGNGTITINGGTVEAFGGEWGAGIGRGYHGYPNAVVITGGNVTAKGGARGAAGIGGGKDTSGVNTTISGGTVCAIGNVDAVYDNIGCGIGGGAKASTSKSLTITGDQLSIVSGRSAANATLTCADTYVRLREPYVRISATEYPVYIVRHMLQKADKSGYDNYEEDEIAAPTGSMTSASFKSYAGFTPKVFEQVRVSADKVTVVEILYDRNDYTIFFDANGHGKAPAALTAPYGAPVSAPAQPQDPEYTFEGWFKDQACTEPFTFTADTKMPLNGAILYAGWIEKTSSTYTVTWTLDDGTVIDTAGVAEGEMPVHADAEKTGYVFTGWTPALAPVTEDITYIASFYEIPHEHTFAETWSSDETNHWHAAACGHAGLAADMAAHQFGEDNICEICYYLKETPAPTGLTLYGLEISVPANKTIYNVGEDFDMTGMVVNALYAKPITDYSLSPQMNLKETDTVITVSYTENGVTKSAHLPITVGSSEKEPYRIIAGANQTIMTAADSAVFASDADFEKFVLVEVDGKEVPEKFYTAESGSTVITFNQEYISTLTEGEHTLRIVSNDGSASTEFTVTSLPATGYPINPILLLILLAAGMGTALLVFAKTRKRNND